MIPITVHVPERRVADFYVRFGEFIANVPSSENPTLLPSGLHGPSWAIDGRGPAIAAALVGEVSGPGQSVLRRLSTAAMKETAVFTPAELAEAVDHPGGYSRVAGLLGGIGKAVRRAGLPLFRTSKGGEWHYVWWWDGERYFMSPEVAKLLRKALRDA